jgi:hypothetical protein
MENESIKKFKFIILYNDLVNRLDWVGSGTSSAQSSWIKIGSSWKIIAFK